MKRIHSLDFLQARPTPWPGWAVAGIGVLVLAATALPLWPLVHLNQARAQALQTAATQADRAIEPTLAAADRQQQAQARRLLQQLDAPWNELFALLEHHADPQIGLLRLEPDAATGQFHMTGLGRSLPVMAAWLRRLEQDPRLSEVQIQQHQIDDLAPGRPVRFSIVARWRAGPADSQPATPMRASLAGTEPLDEVSLPATPGAPR